MRLKYKYKVGDLVKITNTCNFNKEFVKVGDIAKVISLSKISGMMPYYGLKSKNWKYDQCSTGFDIELYKSSKNKLKEKILKLEENQKLLKSQIEEYKDKIKKLEEKLKEQNPKIIKRITLKQFFESKDTLAIHCTTEEKAKELLDAFGKMHKKWRSGELYNKDDTNWKYFKENTCYFNVGTWATTSEVLKGNVYNFEEVDLTIPLEYLCSKEEKTILKNLDKEYQFIYKNKKGDIIIQKNYNFDKYDFELLNIFTGLFKFLEVGKKYRISELIKE